MAAKPRKLMPDDPITLATLTQFHREVMLPDVQRIVGEAVGELRREFGARFDEVNRHFDSVYQRFERLETEYHMLVVGLKRVEERLDKMVLKSELADLKARVDGLQEQIRVLEGRLTA